jgi:lipid-A-disaccharide synthase-like uncharacterized protein
MKISRAQVIGISAVLLILPVLVWFVLVQTGQIGKPGEPLRPPFNLSDRIVTIEVAPDSEGTLRARFDGWKEGDPELSADEFYTEVLGRTRTLPAIYRILDVTSLTGVLWVVFGFAGQAVFMGRMIAQWLASEKAKSSVVPPIFWWMSLLGSSMLMVYFLWRKDLVGFLGQSTGWVIYIRNLWFIHGKTQQG